LLLGKAPGRGSHLGRRYSRRVISNVTGAWLLIACTGVGSTEAFGGRGGRSGDGGVGNYTSLLYHYRRLPLEPPAPVKRCTALV
jgi:hypothetical protein